MSNILQIGYVIEGSTDERFLSNIIQKAFEHEVFNCNSEIEVYEPVKLKKTGNGIVEQIRNIAIKHHYFHVICVHCDSDSPDMNHVLEYSINPAFKTVNAITEEEVCKNLVAIIPVQMTEAWMMADFSLLKDKMGTDMTNAQLSLPIRVNGIEGLADPKETIINAYRLSQERQSRRRRIASISDLYSPVSKELSIENLSQLPSFRVFMDNVRKALVKLNYL
nr:DUF4276 family protein [uncultured Draconibacterium sp.]